MPGMTQQLFETLNQLAWRTQFHDPGALQAVADELCRSFAAGTVEQAWGQVHQGWAARFHRQADAFAAAMRAASEIFALADDAAGIAMCCEMQAREQADRGDQDAAQKLLERADAAPDACRRSWERVASLNIRFAIANRFATAEQALRIQYRTVAAARQCDDALVLGQALSMLGGKHAELNNLDTAIVLCREAYALTAAVKPRPAWSIAALNLLLALNGAAEAAPAQALADELQAVAEHIHPALREQACILCARAYLLGGDTEAAQRVLDQSQAHASGRNHSHSVSATQAGIWYQQGKPRAARQLCEQWLYATPQNEMFLSPSVALRIHRIAADACAALADFESALRYERAASRYSEIELGRAAQARRVALEVEFDIERERAAREQAEQARQQSDAERLRLDELNRQLDAALQTRTRFLAAASHDLRQPAHALALYAVALEQETSRDALHALARRVRATVNSLSGMFDGLIELARLDAGAVEVRAAPVAVDDLLLRLRAEYADRIPVGDTRLALRTALRPLWLHTDGVLLERILRNLIGNAVKYASEGNILVAVRALAGGACAIEVRDAGRGIAEADQRRVFDEFFQAATDAGHRDGLGLGLAIVQRFARLLGMSISLRSAPGRGSTFRLEIPATILMAAPPIEQATLASTNMDPVASLRLLVIDDDADARDSLALVLTQWRHDVIAVADACSALRQVQERGAVVDAVISDYQLAAGRTGAQAIAQIREAQHSEIPALVVSGAHDEQMRAAVAAIGAAYLSKPVRPLRLKSWLSTVSRRMA